MDAFEAAFALVASLEGGFTQSAADPGGATKYGISQRAYPGLDIAQLTLEDAKAIYRRDYWDKNSCGEMPWPWALAVFDCAVNEGDVAKLLQQALATVEDGVIGARTLALLSHAAADGLQTFLALRAERYARAREFSIYGRGWLKRLFRIAQAAEHPPG